jgi:hypothetical protein
MVADQGAAVRISPLTCSLTRFSIGRSSRRSQQIAGAAASCAAVSETAALATALPRRETPCMAASLTPRRAHLLSDLRSYPLYYRPSDVAGGSVHSG